MVDLFAGPGGLGEGFSSLGSAKDPSFQIVVSAEMEEAAHSTLRLRAYYRLLRRAGNPKLLDRYYAFCHGERNDPFEDASPELRKRANDEALRLTLGTPESDRQLEQHLDQLKLKDRPWVLIGGPPCQAYSLVGRSRNAGKKNYVPEDDHRHYLYREYLRVIQRYRPAVFVMENVKGILSSRVGDQKIFHAILKDLADPDAALNAKTLGYRYRIHSLVVDESFDSSMDAERFNASAFVVRAEKYGIPQARHRVILLGVREGLGKPTLLQPSDSVHVTDVIRSMPKLRSALSGQPDRPDVWESVVREHAADLALHAREKNRSVLAKYLEKIAEGRLPSDRGALRVRRYDQAISADGLSSFLADPRLRCWLNHEARSHMKSDLRRYVFAAAFAECNQASPKGHTDFDLRGLAPKHQNWKSGKFADRFRVQLWNNPGTTITSHISKDGHYYIHPDPMQCRSLTVREAARIQTFPDNYFFMGNRTQQFVQVGNAVPPFLAKQIAEIVDELLP